MALPKVILYYAFTPISDTAVIKVWQKFLCQSLNLKGRIIISPQGINGVLGGDIDDLKKYIRQSRSYEGFAKMKFKWSDGTGNDFPKLSVKVRPELVAFGNPDEIKVDKNGVIGGGKHLKPSEVDELVSKRGDDVVFFDGRNSFEAQVGRFKNAVVPDTAIRCEVLSAVMKTRGFKEVYQIDGGIITYGNEIGDDGLWEGALHTFDNRMSLKFSERSKSIGQCEDCSGAATRFYDCPKVPCNALNLLCAKCAQGMSSQVCSHPQRKYSNAELIG